MRAQQAVLAMAEAWLELADRARKVANPRIADHPLVLSKLGHDQAQPQ
jgi:hypothetical protein